MSEQNHIDADESFLAPTGGFRVSRNRTLDRLAAAAAARDIAAVQRIALMTLTWWNGHTSPLPCPDERATYDRIAERIPLSVEMEAKPRLLDRARALFGRLRHHLRGPG